mmetsp:Transcript_28793/g.77999  ORF Transcript_28793/g.77999 Transcript_28793/m.77999 type:complete len:1034 (+) Transcript_28793:224-3325(+)|eukprot:CAMPEP_0172360426 /NCGR_PEP_ID=MMETSP1060-20121228/4446_1 /TAXON_ID=37318 /ORGANISM="Pseudo-nitzschia pungens, Strain cf. cingulata" /LENGTH=1033 /DNA_ID=CAMNT_0013082409 /DNA_START=173 /DNA_END=3274 /DNA_ORIENTATION=-
MNGYIDAGEDSSLNHFGGSSDATPSTPESSGDKNDIHRPDTFLEGWMLKRNRNNYWQDRYFIFQSNQNLSYWHKPNKKDKDKNNTKNYEIDATNGSKGPTASFEISRQAGCEVGDLYVEQRSSSSLSTSMPSVSNSGGKISLYCIDITWTEETEMVITQQGKLHRRNYSDEILSPQNLDDDNRNQGFDSNHNWDQVSVNSTNSARRKKTSFLRRRKLGKRKSDPEVLHNDDKWHEHYSTDPHRDLSPRRPIGSGGAPINELEIDNFYDASEITDPLILKTTKSEDYDLGDGLRRQSSFEEREKIEQEQLHNQFASKQRRKRSVKTKRVVGATKVAMAAGAAVGLGVVTAGAGLAAGILFLGGAAAIGGTAGVAEAGLKRTLKKKDSLTIASTDYTTARLWKNKLDACLEQEYIKNSTWAQRFAAEGGRTASTLIPRNVVTLKTCSSDELDRNKGAGNDNFNRSAPKSNMFLRDANFLEQGRTKWVPLDGGWGNGSRRLRIFKEEKIGDDERTVKVLRSATGDDSSCTPLKTQLVLNIHPAEAFMCIMSYARLSSSPIYNDNSIHLSPNSGQSASHRLIERIDDHMDVLHLICRPLYLAPAWTKPRDYVLNRYWRCDLDGSFIICYESTEHDDCPPQPGFVRGTLHQVYTIAAPKSHMHHRKGSMASECMLTAVVQVNPQGWVPTRPIICQRSKQTYADLFSVAALLQTLDIRDAIETDRFEDLSPDLHPYQQQTLSNVNGKTSGMIARRNTGELAAFDPRFVNRERCDTFTSENFPSIGNIPAPLGPERWAEPDPNSFLVRGPNYLHDGKKINAGSSIGQLIAMDCVLVDKPILSGMSVHPTERIQLALKREREMKEKGQLCDTPAFVFVVNIVVPAAQCFHAVLYYAINDMSTIDGSDGTPSSRLCQKFFFGESDQFRDETFKLIPRIVEANFLVRKAVGSTPAIMGTRLKQYYTRTERFMELVLDCRSSQVAEGVIKLSLGYAKTLVVDMGFLLEAVEEEHLPERILGCVRVKYPSFGNELRWVKEQPLSH